MGWTGTLLQGHQGDALENIGELSDYEARTAIMEAGLVISGLADIWEMWNLQDKLSFWDTYLKVLWDEENPSGDFQINKLKETEELTDWHGEPFEPAFRAAVIQMEVMAISCAFAVQALKAKKNSKVAWAYVGQANHWLGILQGIISGRSLERGATASTMSALGKMGADASHIENRAMKKTVFEWCEQNMHRFPSVEGATRETVNKLVPVTYRTLRDWIAEWNKLRAGAKQ